jgi:aldose 1-epimerase
MPARELIEVASGDHKALIDEQGATLVQVTVAGTQLLAAANPGSYPGTGCHGQLLIPWPGRVPDGRYRFDGEDHQLPINDLVLNSAIHGLVRWLPWRVLEQGPGSVTMGYRLLAMPGYPFSLAIEHAYAWQGDRLEMRATATNIGPRTAPYGYGAHPYFTVGTPTVDDAVLHVPAEKYFVTDDCLKPRLPAVPVEGSPYDFRQPRRIGTLVLDTTYAELPRDQAGRAQVKLSSGDGSLTITCSYAPEVNYVQLYSGDTLDEGVREGLAIEPYTSLPDAFNNGVGLMSLAPGASATVRWAISAS